VTEPSKFSRRDALKGAMLVPVTAGLGLPGSSPLAQQLPSNAKALVAYFSRTGNTRVIAGQIHRARGADLFEIQPAEPYPEDYEAVVSQAQRERDTGYEPLLRAMVPDVQSYAMVFLGFPIWGMTAPPVIRSFLSGHDLSGKTLVPFITHGGYGLGQSLAVLAKHAPKARLLKAFAMKADQERETLRQVTRWLS
jgi:flavodoxin